MTQSYHWDDSLNVPELHLHASNGNMTAYIREFQVMCLLVAKLCQYSFGQVSPFRTQWSYHGHHQLTWQRWKAVLTMLTSSLGVFSVLMSAKSIHQPSLLLWPISSVCLVHSQEDWMAETCRNEQPASMHDQAPIDWQVLMYFLVIFDPVKKVLLLALKSILITSRRCWCTSSLATCSPTSCKWRFSLSWLLQISEILNPLACLGGVGVVGTTRWVLTQKCSVSSVIDMWNSSQDVNVLMLLSNSLTKSYTVTLLVFSAVSGTF